MAGEVSRGGGRGLLTRARSALATALEPDFSVLDALGVAGEHMGGKPHQVRRWGVRPLGVAVVGFVPTRCFVLALLRSRCGNGAKSIM